MTQQDLQDAMVADIQQLFEHSRRENSLGVVRPVAVYAQDLPIREADDEGEDKDAPPEPFVIVRLRSGEVATEDSAHVVEVALVVCINDPSPDRQGCRDALHIVNEIYRHYVTNGIIAGKYDVQYPFKWVTQDVDTHPYYYAGISMNVEMPAYTKEVPEI